MRSSAGFAFWPQDKYLRRAPVSTEFPRRGRGVAATRLYGIFTSRPRTSKCKVATGGGRAARVLEAARPTTVARARADRRDEAAKLGPRHCEQDFVDAPGVVPLFAQAGDVEPLCDVAAPRVHWQLELHI